MVPIWIEVDHKIMNFHSPYTYVASVWFFYEKSL